MSKKRNAKKEDEAELQPMAKGSIQKRDEVVPQIQQEPEEISPVQKGKKGKGGRGFMNFGGGAPDKGLLDDKGHYNDDDGDIEEGGRGAPKRKKSQIKGNQDLWLLYLLFKAISLMW